MKNLKAALMLSMVPFLLSAQDHSDLLSYERASAMNQRSAGGRTAYPGDDRFDVGYYKLDLNIDHESKHLSASVLVTAKASTSIQSFFLDVSSSLTVDSVLSKDLKLTFEQLDEKVMINLEREYAAAEVFSAEVFYHGYPDTEGDGGLDFRTHGDNLPSIYSLSPPYFAPEWWPCKDTPADKADSTDVWITCDKSLVPVSNGLLAGVDQHDATHTYRWKNRHPIAHYLVSVSLANYTLYEKYFHYSDTDSMQVIHYIFPETFDGVKSELDKTHSMLEIFTEVFGPYPFLTEKYAHAEVDFGGGMENQTVSSLGNFNEFIISHELAHQWFGDKITCRDWHHTWLNEGFATYSTGIFYEKYHGKNRYDDFIGEQMEIAKTSRESVYVNNTESFVDVFNYPRVYAKGAIALHMLRGVVGDSAFFKIINRYANDPFLSYGVATTEDFQSVAESISGTDLDYFFSEWIYGENYPVYFYEWDTTPLGDGRHEVSFTLHQHDNSIPSFFTMPVQVLIETSSGDTLLTVMNDAQHQEFTFDIHGTPIDLIIDPHDLILKENLSVVSIGRDEVTDPNHFRNYPNPFHSETTLEFYLETDGLVELFVSDLVGKRVRTMMHQVKARGNHRVNFEASDLSPGLYFFTLRANGFRKTIKALLR